MQRHAATATPVPRTGGLHDQRSVDIVERMLHGGHRDLRHAYDVQAFFISPNEDHVHADLLRRYAGRLLEKLARSDETGGVISGLVTATSVGRNKRKRRGRKPPGLGFKSQRILMCVCEFIAAKLAGSGWRGACPRKDSVTVSKYARRCGTSPGAIRLLELRVLNAVGWRLLEAE